MAAGRERDGSRSGKRDSERCKMRGSREEDGSETWKLLARFLETFLSTVLSFVNNPPRAAHVPLENRLRLGLRLRRDTGTPPGTPFSLPC